MTFTGTIQPGHGLAKRIQFDTATAAKLNALVGRKPVGTRVDVTVENHDATRSGRANAFYWSTVVKLACEHTGYDPDEFHDEMCARFLTRRQIEIVDRQTGEAEIVTVPGRSSKLSVADFYAFVERVRRFLAEELGVSTPDPDPAHWRKERAA